MKIRFDSTQAYQLDAIQSVVDLFTGQSTTASAFELSADAGFSFSELGFGNQLNLSEKALLENLHKVQARNGLELSEKFDGLNFATEMETGTGKTYIYLRTIFELHRSYNFNKFIIVMPSVPIREGVLASLRLMREHFSELYGHVPFDSWTYDSKQVSRLRQFATANTLQVLIMNIDAFNKSANIIHKDNDRLSGRKPIEFIQAAKPIVIMDEPQNMESELAQQAISSLNPLCTLRYSATHRNHYNMIYRLDPVKAYDLKLVKRIEVDSVMEDADFNRPYIQLESVKASKTTLTAKVKIDIDSPQGVKRKSISAKHGDDLQQLANGRSHYAGYVVTAINSDNIEFGNGISMVVGEVHGTQRDEVMRVQIRNTVREHFDKELKMGTLPTEQRMKILSLFFIDRVANYHAADGKIRLWFEEEYRRISGEAKYNALNPLPVESVHNGYFSIGKDKAPKDTSGKTQADDDAYELIMRDKERLLQPGEPLRFIFSHSALREGWDNPNVFQICTLAESQSEIKKRQEIGRGLRLPVMANGERCLDANLNRLTVIANESYEDFARKLQTEIEEETGIIFSQDRIANKHKRKAIRLKKGWELNEDFRQLWERICQRTRYAVQYSSEELINKAAKAISDMPPIKIPEITTQKANISIGHDGVTTEISGIRTDRMNYLPPPIPDLLGYLQRETELTRSTLSAILRRSGRLGDVTKNPQQFLDQSLKQIRDVLHELMIAGINYEKVAGAWYEMQLFQSAELEAYAEHVLEVNKSIFNAIEFDSAVESEFAKTLDLREDILLFFKLPGWFKIDTPLGTYNPDWAIVKKEDGKVYLVRETKGAIGHFDLRGAEAAKIRCGKKHFAELGVDFQPVSNANQV